MLWHLLSPPDALALKTACEKLTLRARSALTSGRSILALRRGSSGWGGLQRTAQDCKIARRRARYALASTQCPHALALKTACEKLTLCARGALTSG